MDYRQFSSDEQKTWELKGRKRNFLIAFIRNHILQMMFSIGIMLAYFYILVSTF